MKMASLLILTLPAQEIVSCLPKVLQAASTHVKNRLYIHLDYLNPEKNPEQLNSLLCRSHLVSKIYSVSPKFFPGVDIRVLLGGFKQNNFVPVHVKSRLENILIDYISDSSDLLLMEKRYNGIINIDNTLVLLKEIEAGSRPKEPEICSEDKTYKDVVLGGTFDRIHPGHKILLSEALLRTTKRLTVGVANGPLLKKKVLKELILPSSERINQLNDFLLDIDHQVDYNIVKIIEPLGPTAYDPLMEMLVVSEETKKGVKLINDHRLEKGLNELDSYCIPIYDDTDKKSDEEENKFSSSSQRMRLLGTRLRPVQLNKNIPSAPYVIGLTGGSASGKTSIGKKIQSMGAGVIDCDKLGHKAYEYNTKCYQELVDIFGRDILNEDGAINRKTLGSLVYQDKEKLKQLTDIVWPAIAALAKEQTLKFFEEGKKVVVLDAAVLLEAKWDQFCHEVWSCIISESEAVRRIVERDGVSEEVAARRISNQMNNEERVSKSNIVFCSFWSYEYTHEQITKAWKILEEEGKV